MSVERTWLVPTRRMIRWAATDEARIRTIMNSALTREYMDYAVNAFEKIGKELEIK